MIISRCATVFPVCFMSRCALCCLLFVLGLCGRVIKKTTDRKQKLLGLQSIHKRNKFGETQLHLAVIKGDLQSVKDLIEAGASVNLADNAGTVQDNTVHKQVQIKTCLKQCHSYGMTDYTFLSVVTSCL